MLAATPSVSRAAISAAEVATASFPPISNAWPPRPAVTPGAGRTPISTPRRCCRAIAVANHGGGPDASPVCPDRGCSRFERTAGQRADLWRRLPGLPACLRASHLLRLHLYFDRAMQRVGVGPRRTMRAGPLFCAGIRAARLRLEASPSRLLRARAVLIESKPLQILYLTRFLHANRCPLRLKTL